MATNDPSQVLPATNDPFSGEDEPFGISNVLPLQTETNFEDKSPGRLPAEDFFFVPVCFAISPVIVTVGPCRPKVLGIEHGSNLRIFLMK